MNDTHDDWTVVSQSDLHELFRGRRVDPEAFRAGIDRRIAARGASPDQASEEPAPASAVAPSGSWRRVAALLPIDPTTGGAMTGAGAAKLFGGKVLPAALVLPAVTVAATLGGFAGSAWSVRESAASGTLGRPRRWPEVGPAVGLGLATCAPLLLLFTPWRAYALDVVVLALTLVMLGLATGVRRLAGNGLLERSAVAASVLAQLMPLLTLAFVQQASFGLTSATSELGHAVAVLALGAATLVVWCESSGRRPSLAAVLWMVLIVLAINPLRITAATPSLARWKLAAAQRRLDPTELTGWREAAALHRALVAIGGEAPRHAEAERALEEALGSRDVALAVHPVVWTAAFDMGLMDAADWVTLDGHLGSAGRSGTSTDYYRYTYPLRLVVAPPSTAERDTWAEGLVASWPTTGDHGALGSALEIVRRVELLGRADLLAGLRERAFALLRDHWVTPGAADWFSSPHGFTPNPKRFRSSSDDATLDAVELMARFGVPEGIDIHQVEAYLRNASPVVLFLPWELGAYLRAEARAALLRVRYELELPQRSLARRLFAERLTLASVLLAALGLYALRAAGPRWRGAGP